ncbi:uncharacterized protein LOC134678921 [Cydia fagiglandana]|uniref:uncharacterized protein LOC134678921 n=1 Tax=Cydia fagiglandana TaxID=1458189 RepID=UPI002FEE48A7
MSSANFGVLDTFDHNVQSWNSYKGRLQQYFIANDIDNAKDATGIKRRAILLTALKEETYKLAADLVLPKQLDSVPYEDIIKLLDNHFTPKRVGFGERHKFYAAVQQAGETHTQWAARLRGLTAYCSFSNVEEALRDRFIMGLLPGLEKEKLYAQNISELTLAKAVEFAENIRCARAGATAAGITPSSSDVYKIASNKQQNKSDEKVKCSKCGYTNHKVSECRFTNYVCKKCKVKGHLGRMCPSVKYLDINYDGEDDDVLAE